MEAIKRRGGVRRLAKGGTHEDSFQFSESLAMHVSSILSASWSHEVRAEFCSSIVRDFVEGATPRCVTPSNRRAARCGLHDGRELGSC